MTAPCDFSQRPVEQRDPTPDPRFFRGAQSARAVGITKERILPFFTCTTLVKFELGIALFAGRSDMADHLHETISKNVQWDWRASWERYGIIYLRASDGRMIFGPMRRGES